MVIFLMIWMEWQPHDHVYNSHNSFCYTFLLHFVIHLKYILYLQEGGFIRMKCGTHVVIFLISSTFDFVWSFFLN